VSSLDPSFPDKIIQVLIAEDHALTNECLKIGLEKLPQFSVVGQAKTGKEAVEKTINLHPVVVLMDLNMPEMNGIVATQYIKKHDASIKVIMVTSYKEKRAVLASLSAGADGYATKEVALEHLVQGIEIVCKGDLWLDASVAKCVMQGIGARSDNLSSEQHAPENTASRSDLTASSLSVQHGYNNPVLEDNVFPVLKVKDVLKDRELQILMLIADSKTNDEIAQQLGLTNTWISAYIRNILEKLSVDSEVQAVRKAYDQGLVPKTEMVL
jgi:DNA-binding NarL/FixJ family response regulator